MNVVDINRSRAAYQYDRHSDPAWMQVKSEIEELLGGAPDGLRMGYMAKRLSISTGAVAEAICDLRDEDRILNFNCDKDLITCDAPFARSYQ